MLNATQTCASPKIALFFYRTIQSKSRGKQSALFSGFKMLPSRRSPHALVQSMGTVDTSRQPHLPALLILFIFASSRHFLYTLHLAGTDGRPAWLARQKHLRHRAWLTLYAVGIENSHDQPHRSQDQRPLYCHWIRILSQAIRQTIR